MNHCYPILFIYKSKQRLAKVFCSYRQTVRVIGEVASDPMVLGLPFSFQHGLPSAMAPGFPVALFCRARSRRPEYESLVLLLLIITLNSSHVFLYSKSFNAFLNRVRLGSIDYQSMVHGPPELNASQDYISFCEITYDCVFR